MYYPKSQITENLYSNSESNIYYAEFPTPITKYIGYYYRVSTGKMFSGRNPQDGLGRELVFFEVIPYVPDFGDGSIDEKTPTYSSNLPTRNDYNKGYFERYFCKKTNEIIYIENSKNTYDKLVNRKSPILWQLYIPFKITWQLKGDEKKTYELNRNAVQFTMKKLNLPKFEEYLGKNYLKYYKETV